MTHLDLFATVGAPVLAATKVWWHLSRASGIVAWGLATAAVVWGLALATRALGPKPRAPWLLDLHRFLGAAALGFVAVHMVSLVFDPFVAFGVADLVVPGAAGWEPAAVAWGVVAFWLLVLVEVTSLAKKRLPARLWKGVHMTSYAIYLAATVHLFAAGSDATNPVLAAAAAASLGVVGFFTLYRWIGPGRAASVRRGPSRSRTGVDASPLPDAGSTPAPGPTPVEATATPR